MRNYKQFILILEGKKRDQKIEKQKQKIHKFLTYEPIIDFVFDTVVDDDSTKGIQYVVWFADKIKKSFLKKINDESTLVEDGKGERLFEPKLFDDFLRGKNNDEKIERIIKLEWRESLYRTIVSTIVDWLKSPIRTEEVTLKDFDTLKKAYDESVKWHDNLEATGVIVEEEGTVLMTFDDGYYWIDLETNSNEDEANAMGHCGTTNYGDTLYSLRIKQSPHVTVAITDGTIYQMKGRNNKKPVEKYHKYIMELLNYPNVSENVRVLNDFYSIDEFSTEEYLAEEDFHVSDLNSEQIKKLMKTNKTLIKNSGISVKYKLYESGDITKEELIDGYSDLSIIDGKIIFTVDGWDQFDQSIFQENSNYTTGWQYEVLEGSYFIDYDYIKFDYTYTYDSIEKRGFEELRNYCTHQGLLITYGDDDFMMSKENTKISPNGDDLWINTPIGGVIPLVDLLSNDKSIVNTKNGEIVFYADDFEELRTIMDEAYTRALSIADESEAYEQVTDAIIDKIGKIVNFDYKKHPGLHFEFIFDWIIEIENRGVSSNSILGIINSVGETIDLYGGDELLIECDPPYNGWMGTIDSNTITEELINKLIE